MAVRAEGKTGRAALVDLLAERFPWVLASYFAMQVLRRLIEPHSLGLDEAEQIVMTQAFAWGYGSQPPLYSWIQRIVFGAIGTSVFSLALLKNTVLFLTFLFVFHASERILRDRLKAVAVTLSLFFVPQIGWESQRALVHTPMVVCAAAATFLCFLHLVEKRRARDYILFAVAIAVGVLSKYSYPLFVVALLGAAMTFSAGRRAVLDWRMFLMSFPISVALTLPTMIWSLTNLEALLSRIGKFDIQPELPFWAARAKGVAELAEKTLAFSILCAAAYLIVAFAPSRRQASPASATGSRLEQGQRKQVALARGSRRITLLIPVFCLGLLVFFTLATGTTDYKDRWLQPDLFLLPLACFVVLEDRLRRRQQAALSGTGAFLALFIVAALLVYNRAPDLQDDPPNSAAPFAVIAGELRQMGFSEGTVVGVESFVTGNILFHFPNARGVTPEYSRLPIRYSPPFLLAWRGATDDAPRALRAAYAAICEAPLPDRLDTRTIKAPFVGSQKHVLRLHVAIIQSCQG